MSATQIKRSEVVINCTNFIRLETNDFIMNEKLVGEGKVKQIDESRLEVVESTTVADCFLITL
ncbi:hypothetical protein HERIO_866 [Hepatospora eriocheir]|uniref:Uncharacterized protein n=1 Tax=Hepatospora eriocheir TaxID=1081669 RepID=A0A1X0QBX2_9MICR|nr:hypothetical protein HERIO_866 [Hepatospora eriocheir]